MTTNNDESDPGLAKRNAELNFERLVAQIPRAAQEREENLLEEVKASQGSAMKKLRLLHQATEELSRAIAPFVACQRGCSACCHYNVHLYPLEAELIEKREGIRRSKRLHPPLDFTGVPCVFLKEDQCSIYDVRPMVCRKHVALTNTSYWCKPERSGSVQLPFANFSQVNAAFEYIIQKDGRYGVSDIRQQFGATDT